MFPRVVRDQVSGTNTLVVGAEQPLSGARMISAGINVPAHLHPLLAAVGDRLVPALPGGHVYTDDRAPVEWLTDLSILRYATGSR